jgi:acyl homoserine lactone synthase
MDHTVVTHSLRELTDADRFGMFSLRYDTFFTRLGWDVATTDDGQEIDQYDKEDRAQYILAKSPLGGVDACWRLLPTLGPNMLRDVFPCLLHGQPAPAAADVWELSRFAIATDRLPSSEDAGNQQIGFGHLSVALMQESVKFAKQNGIARYVTVTTAAIERMLKRQNVNIHRLGPPIRIGQVMTVACFIEIDDVTATALGM